jgi:hypothetical protein
VVQVIEDGQGVLPGAAGGVVVSGGLVGVAEMGEALGPVAQVASLAIGIDGLLITRDCLDTMAQVVVGVAEAVQVTASPGRSRSSRCRARACPQYSRASR